MGCDIHSVAIDATGTPLTGGNWADGKIADPEYGVGAGEPFGWRSYRVFGFLAGVRNYSGVPSISEPRGLPDDLKCDQHAEPWLGDHSFSWLSVAELLAFDYDAPVEDRRTTIQLPGGGTNGGATAPQGDGKTMTWREFLGPGFFHDLAELQLIGAHRVAFGFDS